MRALAYLFVVDEPKNVSAGIDLFNCYIPKAEGGLRVGRHWPFIYVDRKTKKGLGVGGHWPFFCFCFLDDDKKKGSVLG